MDITLYTTNCPKCKVLEAKLNSKEIEYKTETDQEVMINKGFMSAPMLEVDGRVMNYKQAVDWVNNLEGQDGHQH